MSYEQTRDEHGKPVIKVDGVIQEVETGGFPTEEYTYVTDQALGIRSLIKRLEKLDGK